MTIQFATSTRNARLDAVEADVGTAPVMRVYTGTQPANAAASATGTLLVAFTLPSDWAANASGGAKAANGLPISATAGATGTAGYFRLWNSAVSTCYIQGSVTATGGGGDATIDNASITSGAPINLTSFTLTDGNP